MAKGQPSGGSPGLALADEIERRRRGTLNDIPFSLLRKGPAVTAK